MADWIELKVHASATPNQFEIRLLDRLKAGRLDQGWLYLTPRQSRLWRQIHSAFAPYATAPDGARPYWKVAQYVCRHVGNSRHPIEVISIGAGGSSKDEALLKQCLKLSPKELTYLPVDISPSLALASWTMASAFLSPHGITPVVMDFLHAEDAVEALEQISRHQRTGVRATRIVLCYGVLPNAEPEQLLPRLARLLGPNDWLLLGTNLAPAIDARRGTHAVFAQYDNAATREWLMAGLQELGLRPEDGTLLFEVTERPQNSGLFRILASFRLRRPRRLQWHEVELTFPAGFRLEVFFSCRYTSQQLLQLLADHGLNVWSQWILQSGQEAVVACQPSR